MQWLPGALHRLVRSFPDPRPAVHHYRAPRPRRADTGPRGRVYCRPGGVITWTLRFSGKTGKMVVAPKIWGEFRFV